MNNIHKKLLYLLVVLLLSPFIKGYTQPSMNYAIHANIIYHFTKYIGWPENKKSGDFVIGIVGDSPLYEELKKIIANKTAGNQRIVVRRLSNSQAVYNCHIIFIGEEESGSLKKIAAKTAGLPVLLVCEEEGMAVRGACIDFALISDRLKLEINKNNIEMRNLNVASELLKLGNVVK